MRNSGFLWMIVGVMVLLDVYVFQALKVIAPDSPRLRTLLYVGYWLVSVSFLLLLILLPNFNYEAWPKTLRTYLFATIVGLFFSKMITSIFLAVDDVRRISMWLLGKWFSNPSLPISQSANGITRSTFMSWLGIAVGGGLFGTLLYGFNNKYRYQVKRVKLQFDNLPEAFRGLRIVHISDIHSGSFTDKQAVAKGVERIVKEQPDVIFFYG